MKKGWLILLLLLAILTFYFSSNDKGPWVSVAGKAKFLVEVAKSPEDRQKGLMYRESLPLNRGMVFVFDQPDDHRFWMKNTFIPLDLIFIDAKGQIVGIIANAQPESVELLSVEKPSLYVLEINAGLSEKLNIKIGDYVEGLENL